MVCATATHVVDETVLGRVVLGLQSTEERLLGTEDLDGTCWVFREREQAACVADEPCADEVANESSEVRRNRVHAIPEVLRKLCAIGGNGDDLVT